MADWYRPDHVSQFTGSSCQGSNCWGAVGAAGVDGATGGKKRPTADAFRERAGGGSGRPNPNTGCGTGLIDDWLTGLASYGVTGRKREHVSIADAKAILEKADRKGLYLVETDYELWPVALKCRAKDFDGNHAVLLEPGVNRKGNIAVMNPVCPDWQRVPLDDVLAGMAKYAREKGQAPGTVRFVKVPRVRIEEPTPVDPCAIVRIELEAVREERDDLREALASARGLLVQIKALLEEG